ncbi:MAG TPA: CPBP family intramembrane glutamic endopeptidase [Puia sp.]|nr:CPBP family intramembrane glutamic endopeptidase [Puia sp.]
MSYNRKISSPRAQMGLFLFLLGAAWLIANLFAGALLVAKGLVSPGVHTLNFSDPQMAGTIKFMQAVSTLIMFGGPAWLYSRITFRTGSLHFLGFRRAERNSFYILGIALLLLAFPLEGWLGQINHHIPLPGWMIGAEKDAEKQISALLRTNSVSDLFINIFIIAILPAVCEEACFRGALQRILIQGFKSPWAGIILSAALFSAFHLQFQGFLPRMFLGILLGALYWYSGSLWTSILAHFFTNGIQVVAVTFYPRFIHEDPSVPLYAALISMAIVVGLLSVLRRQSSASYARVYEEGQADGYKESLD